MQIQAPELHALRNPAREDTMNRSTETLFRPFPFGDTTLANRIVMAPMTRSKSPGGVPTAEVAAYYRRRAEGGVGLIVTAFRGRSAQPSGIDELLRRLEAGEFDLVAVGRALLADPQWPTKVREARWKEIIPFTPECLASLS